MTKFKPSFDPQRLVGKRFGKLTVVKFSHKKSWPKRSTYYWECLCDCGKTVTVSTGHLNAGCVVSCGCYREYVNKNKGHTKEEIIAIEKSIVPDANGCKIWPYTLNEKGYGKISFKNKTCEAHRLVYRAYHGELEKGKQVRHLCNNRACVNIEHLAIGTPKDNAQDAVKAGSYHTGENHHSAKLTWAIVREIRTNEMGISNSALSRKYKVARCSIRKIKNNTLWKEDN